MKPVMRFSNSSDMGVLYARVNAEAQNDKF